jgi:hypothetical protein
MQRQKGDVAALTAPDDAIDVAAPNHGVEKIAATK